MKRARVAHSAMLMAYLGVPERGIFVLTCDCMQTTQLPAYVCAEVQLKNAYRNVVLHNLSHSAGLQGLHAEP